MILTPLGIFSIAPRLGEDPGGSREWSPGGAAPGLHSRDPPGSSSRQKTYSPGNTPDFHRSGCSARGMDYSPGNAPDFHRFGCSARGMDYLNGIGAALPLWPSG